MRRYLALLASIAAVFLVTYLVVEALDVPILTDPRPLTTAGEASAAAAGVGLLIADVVLPVPSSLVMVGQGAMFGIALGAFLSLLGRAGSFLLGYYLGRYSIRTVRRFIRTEDLARANDAVHRWGLMAIVGTRPLPIMSETMSIAAGISRLPPGRSLLAATLGSLPEAVVFAATGAIAGTFLNTSYVFVGVIATMLLVWWLSRRASPNCIGVARQQQRAS